MFGLLTQIILHVGLPWRLRVVVKKTERRWYMGSSQAQIVLGTRKFDVHPEPKKREWGWHNIGELVRLVNGLLRVDESPVKTIERYILMGYPPSQTVNQPSIDVVLDVKKSLICQPFTMREFSLYETILAEGYVPSGWGGYGCRCCHESWCIPGCAISWY